MPNRAAPYGGSRYSGLFKDMVNNRTALYHNGALVHYMTGNDAVFSDSVTIPVMPAGTTAALPQALTIGGIAYTFPADDGDAGEQLQSNGSGVLTWEASGV